MRAPDQPPPPFCCEMSADTISFPLRMSAPPRLFTAPNLVTAVRACLVVFLATRLAYPPGLRTQAWIAVVVATIVAVLDGVDGWLARRTDSASPFGARFDMETDALLILVLSVLVWRWDKAGPWVLLSGLMRYLFAAAHALFP